MQTGVEMRGMVFEALEVALLSSDLLNDVEVDAAGGEAREGYKVEEDRRVFLFCRRDSLVLPRGPADVAG